MSHTNSTPNYNLPQFITTDKPFWLTDINGAFSDIDTAINTAKTTADTASGNAIQALSDASDANTAAAAADAKAVGSLASTADTFDATATYAVGDVVIYNSLLYRCTNAVTTPGPWTGVTNWTRTTTEQLISEKADGTTVSGISTLVNGLNTDIDGYKFLTYTLNGDDTLLTLPSYNDACIILIGRAGAGLYYGHWTGVTPLIDDTNFEVRYYANPSRINITNHTPTTARITVIMK